MKKIVDLLKESLYKNAFYLLGILTIGTLFGFAFWTIVARLYVPEVVGLASSIISIAQFTAGLASLGLGGGYVRYLASTENPRKLINTSISIVIVVNLIVSSIYIIGLRYWAPSLIFIQEDVSFTVVFIVMQMAACLLSIYQMVFVAYRQSKYAFLQTLFVNMLRLVLAFVFIPLGLMGILLSMIIGTVAAVVSTNMVFFPRLFNTRSASGFSLSEIKPLFAFSFGNFFSDMLYRSPIFLFPSFLLNYLGPEASARAFIAWMIGTMISSVAQAFSNSIFAEGASTPESLGQYLYRGLGVSMLTTVPLAAICGLFAPFLLMLFGQSYIEASHLLIWLSLASLPMAVNTLFFSVLRVNKNVKALFYLSLVSAIVTFLVARLQVMTNGIVATGYGWFCSQILLAFFVAVHIRKVFRQKQILI